jgi:lysophospholipase L1-like esterase
MTFRPRRSAAIALVAGVVALTAACSAGATRSAPTPEPTVTARAEVGSIAVIGDSISLGVAACGAADACPESSWAIGTDPAVASIASRITQLTGATPRTEALARPGARVADAQAAVAALSDSDVDLVLVLIGANDACAPSADAVTDPADFAAAYATLLAEVSAAVPDARIVAFSLPDLERLWQLGRTDPATVQAWDRSPSCRSLLQDAASDEADDVDRRAAIAAALTSYDTAIAEACGATPSCTSDAGAVHAARFEEADVSAVDRFHPSAQGQAKLAEAAWSAVAGAIGADPSTPAP